MCFCITIQCGFSPENLKNRCANTVLYKNLQNPVYCRAAVPKLFGTRNWFRGSRQTRTQTSEVEMCGCRSRGGRSECSRAFWETNTGCVLLVLSTDGGSGRAGRSEVPGHVYSECSKHTQVQGILVPHHAPVTVSASALVVSSRQDKWSGLLSAFPRGCLFHLSTGLSPGSISG